MNLATFIQSSLEQHDNAALAQILQLFASKLHLQHLELDPTNFQVSTRTSDENLNENFTLVNLSKRVEGCEEVTRALSSTFEVVKSSCRCLCAKLEETRAFANKIFDEIEKLKGAQPPPANSDDDEKSQIREKLEKLEQIIADDEKSHALDSKVENLDANFRHLQTSCDNFREHIDDLTFTCELLEGSSHELEHNTSKLTQSLNCTKKEVKRIGANMAFMIEDQKMSMISMQTQLDRSIDEHGKSHKADMDAKLSTHRDDFFAFRDAIAGNVKAIEARLNDMTVHAGIRHAQLRNRIDAKLNVDELVKFRSNLRQSFDAFVLELENALDCRLGVLREGFAGRKLQFACLSCDGPMTMVDRVKGSARPMKSIANRFKLKIDRQPAPKFSHAANKSRADILDLLEGNGHDGNCYIVAEDRAVLKADPERCGKYPKL